MGPIDLVRPVDDDSDFSLARDAHERYLEAARASIQGLRQSLTIHHEMFRRALETEPAPLLLLQTLLEDLGNCYLDLAERIIQMSKTKN